EQDNTAGTRTALQKFVLGAGKVQDTNWHSTDFIAEDRVSSSIEETQARLDELAGQDPVSVIVEYFDPKKHSEHSEFDDAKVKFTESIRKTIRAYARAGYLGGVAT